MAETPQKKTNTKAPPRRRMGTAPAAKLASGLMSRAIKAKGFAQVEVVSRWPQIVGHELAASTLPVRLIFPRGERMGAKLVVRCESAFAPLLQHKAAMVIEQVNCFFGYGAVASLEVKQGPIYKRQMKPQLMKKDLAAQDRKKLEDITGTGELSPLKAALQSLGEMVLSNKK